MVYDQHYCVIDCLVRNISEAGARLVFASPAVIPAEFDLLFSQKGSTRRAQVTWRKELDVGVQFLSGRSEVSIPLEAAQTIRTLKTQNERLLRRLSELSESAI